MSHKTKPLAAIGSPSTTVEMSLDILGVATNKRLVGSLVCFDLQQEGREVRVTGQITEIEMRNRWHENDVMKSVIKQDGGLPYLQGQDILTAKLSPGAVFARDHSEELWGHEVLGTVPSAGTKVIRLDQATLNELVEAQKEDIFYIGRAYGDNDVSMPTYLKHFGDPYRGGQGEAYHSLVVGKTGSGKSTLAKFMLSGYARHDAMAILIIDPKGEFADEISGYAVGESGLPFRGILKGMNRSCRRYGITQVRLEGYELFEDVLLSLGLEKDLNIRGSDNKLELAAAITEIIRHRETDFNLETLRDPANLEYILQKIVDENDGYVERIYKSKEPQENLRKEIEKILVNPDHRIWGTWDFLGFLFEKGDGSRQTVGQIVRTIMESPEGDRPLIVLDLSVPGNRRDIEDLGSQFDSLRRQDDERELFTDALQKKIIYRIVSDMRRLSETIVSNRVRQGLKSNVNTLIVFEEAHRYAPRHVQSDDDDGKKLKAKLIEAVRETRKFGLGWFFIDQTIGGLDKEIIHQVRCSYIGYGLSMGEELNAVREMVGGDQRDVTLYRSFKDPASFGKPSEKKFPWMAFGPVSPMAANHPLFFNAFDGQTFVEANNLPVDSSDRPMRLPPQLTMARGSKKTVSKVIPIDQLPDDLLS